ncbi:fumarylacetoacetate hydrolase family protein [Pseudoclavibacter terrae]|uniref:fumarylacetoacetate hydrolase family protein n=1 Tax=Pseudoclavibacter terrae TaxID=1530195 RepID=UPI00232EAE25|nr:fumarylacetoacetate hydrolase family protein [Pseudoclavibacter terrae]
MTYISYQVNGTDHVGVVEGNSIRPLLDVTHVGNGIGTETLEKAERSATVIPRASVRLRPASPFAKRIICVGLNYKSHIEETRRDDSDYPVLFPKYASSLIADGDDILLPPEGQQPDYEGELAVIIGRRGRRISESDALDHVLGYTPANDVTIRDFQYLTHQWMQGKAWDNSTPLGSEIVTPAEVDLSASSIRTIIDGETVQESPLELMIFSIRRLIAEISVFTELEPGDVILTGTPGGVGYRRSPQRFIRPGERIIVEIDGVGRIENGVDTEVLAR